MKRIPVPTKVVSVCLPHLKTPQYCFAPQNPVPVAPVVVAIGAGDSTDVKAEPPPSPPPSNPPSPPMASVAPPSVSSPTPSNQLTKDSDVINNLVKAMERQNPVEFSLPKDLVQDYCMPGACDYISTRLSSLVPSRVTSTFAADLYYPA